MIITTDRNLINVTEDDLDESGNFIVPDEVETIESFCFAECNKKLKKIVINQPVHLMKKCFYECTELRTITYNAKINFCSVGENLFKNIERNLNSLSIYTKNYNGGLIILDQAWLHYKEIKFVFSD